MRYEFGDSGRDLVPVRPFRELFPLRTDQGQNLQPGKMKDGRHVLMAYEGREHFVILAFFDEQGRFLNAEHYPTPDAIEYTEECDEWVRDRFGFEPGVIWMREFRTLEGLGIRWLPRSMVDTYVYDLGQSRNDYESTGEFWSWMYRKAYVIDWCNTPWASGLTGEITDT